MRWPWIGQQQQKLKKSIGGSEYYFEAISSSRPQASTHREKITSKKKYVFDFTHFHGFMVKRCVGALEAAPVKRNKQLCF
jgi:hypothetical protein